jgi:tetraacyldisaccharide 4'-kinase
MTEYLVTVLSNDFKTATLSRGYKRKTKGFAIADESTTAIHIGDEPMQFHRKFPDLTVAVGEERLVAIPQLLHARPGTEVIILDDAFQHRQVRAGFNIVLTDYRNLYTRDLILPAGDLRDVKSSIKRAQTIIVTKCRPDLSGEEKEQITREINPGTNQRLYFTEIVYHTPYQLFTRENRNILPTTDILLLTGIANPKPLKEFLTSNVQSYDMLRYPDHHIFSSDDLKDIIKQFERIESADKVILTTEKDGVRLEKFSRELSHFPIYVLPIKHRFLFDGDQQFQQEVKAFVRSFDRQPQQ